MQNKTLAWKFKPPKMFSYKVQHLCWEIWMWNCNSTIFLFTLEQLLCNVRSGAEGFLGPQPEHSMRHFWTVFLSSKSGIPYNFTCLSSSTFLASLICITSVSHFQNRFVSWLNSCDSTKANSLDLEKYENSSRQCSQVSLELWISAPLLPSFSNAVFVEGKK